MTADLLYPETGSRRLRCALFVDFDNVYLGLRRLDPEAAELFAGSPGTWLSALETGSDVDGDFARRFLIRACYLNPSAFSQFRPNFTRAGFSVVDCPSLTQQGKSSADINLVLDAVDALAASTHYDEFVILSADADFTPLALRWRAADRRVTVITASPAASAYRAVADTVIGADELVELVRGPEGLDVDVRTSAPTAPAGSRGGRSGDAGTARGRGRSTSESSEATEARGAADAEAGAPDAAPARGREAAATGASGKAAAASKGSGAAAGKGAARGSTKSAAADTASDAAKDTAKDAADAAASGSAAGAANAAAGGATKGGRRGKGAGTTSPRAAEAAATTAVEGAEDATSTGGGGATTEAPATGGGAGDGGVTRPRSAARLAALRTVRAADRPLRGGLVATAVQKAEPGIGAGGWDGAGSFFAWLAREVPELAGSPRPAPGFVWDPRRFTELDLPGNDVDLPPLQRQVVDVTDIPNLPTERYRALIEALAADVADQPFDRAATAGRVRDACQAAGHAIGRSSVNTVISGVLYAGLDLAGRPSAQQIATTWAANVLGLCRGARMVMTPADEAAIRSWVGGGLAAVA